LLNFLFSIFLVANVGIGIGMDFAKAACKTDLDRRSRLFH